MKGQQRLLISLHLSSCEELPSSTITLKTMWIAFAWRYKTDFLLKVAEISQEKGRKQPCGLHKQVWAQPASACCVSLRDFGGEGVCAARARGWVSQHGRAPLPPGAALWSRGCCAPVMEPGDARQPSRGARAARSAVGIHVWQPCGSPDILQGWAQGSPAGALRGQQPRAGGDGRAPRPALRWCARVGHGKRKVV